MSAFLPDHRFDTVLDVTPEFLHSLGITAVILDVDNTLAGFEKKTPADGVIEWLGSLKESGISCIIVSNNGADRVSPFAGQIGLDFVPKGKKPLGFGIRKACERLDVKPDETAMIGDQIFTDVLGGNLSGLTTILVEPYEPEQTRFFRLKRRFERFVLRHDGKKERK